MPSAAESVRSLPNNEEAERAVLGSILLDNTSLFIALETINKDDFFWPRHRIVFEKMVALAEKNRTVDLVTLSEELGMEGLVEKAGGATYLASLTDGVPIGTSATVNEYARIIKEKSIIRQLINTSNNVITRCLQGTEDAQTLVDSAQSQVFEISADKIISGFRGVNEIVKESFGTIENLLERGGAITGIGTPFPELDRMTSGLQPGELIVLAARPSLGKTALALNIASHASIKAGKHVGVFSLEMSKESLVIRLLCAEGDVDSHNLRGGFLDRERDWPRVMKAVGRLAMAPIYIEDTPALSIMQIRAKARRVKAEKGLDLLIVDYLQLVTTHGKFENRTQEVSYISRGLKSIAKELNVPVLALSQLSRAPEQRGGRPLLSDLRESGSIEQDADVVIFIYRERPRTAGKEDEAFQEEPGVETKLIIGKQRNGPTGEVPVVFLKPYGRFAPLGRES